MLFPVSRKFILLILIFCFCAFAHAQTNQPQVKLKLTIPIGGDLEKCDFVSNDEEIRIELKEKIQFRSAQTGKLLRVEAKTKTSEPKADGYIYGLSGAQRKIVRLKKAPGEKENRVVVWDIEKNQITSELKGFQQKIVRAFSSRGDEKILTVGETKNPSVFALPTAASLTELIVWDAETGRLQSRLTLENYSENYALSNSIFSSDGSKFVTNQFGLQNKTTAKVWSAETGKLLYETGAPTNITSSKNSFSSDYRIGEIFFTPDGDFLIGAVYFGFYSYDKGQTVVWNAGNGEIVWQAPGDRFKLSADGRILAGVPDVREVKTGRLLSTLKIEPGTNKIACCNGIVGFENLVLSSSNKLFITANQNRADVWDLGDGKRRCSFSRVYTSSDAFFGDSLYSDVFRFAENEKFIVASNSKYLRLLNAENCELVQKIENPLLNGNAVLEQGVWSADERLLLTTSKDKKSVIVWEITAN